MSFLAVEVVDLGHAKEFSLGLQHPFFRVGIPSAVGGWIVGDDVEDEIFRAGVDDLVGRAGWLHESIAGLCGVGRGINADGGGAADHDEEFPLDGVGMLWADRCSGWHAADLKVEGMSAAPGSDILRRAEGEGNVFAE